MAELVHAEGFEPPITGVKGQPQLPVPQRVNKL